VEPKEAAEQTKAEICGCAYQYTARTLGKGGSTMSYTLYDGGPVYVEDEDYYDLEDSLWYEEEEETEDNPMEGNFD
jgi:hypothetical protein